MAAAGPRFRCLFFLALAASALPLRAAPIQITGRVELPPGCGPGRVSLFPARSAGEEARLRLEGKDDPALSSARVSPDGAFEIAAAEAGLYRVVIEAEGCVPLEQALVAASDLELPPAKPERVRPTKVLVLGPDGQPAAGIPVVAASGSSSSSDVWPTGTLFPWSPAERRGVTGADGRLVLPRGGERDRTDLRAPGISAGWGTGEDRPTLRMPVRRKRRFTVRGADGRPRAGVLARSGPLPLALSGPDGGLEILAADGERITFDGGPGELGWIDLPKEARAPLVVTLDPPRTVRGRVLDAASSAPLGDALVWRGGPPAVRTSADGAFVLPVHPEYGGEIAAAAPGHLPATVWPKEGVEPVLVLSPAAEIRGLVSDASGKPIAGAKVSAGPLEDNARELRQPVEVRTAADGRFRLPGLPAGRTLRLQVGKEGFASVVRLADAGANSPVEIVLGRGAVVAGRVLDEAGRPLADIQVTLSVSIEGAVDPYQQIYLRQDVGSTRTATDAEGRFRFSNLGPGRFTLRATREGFLPVDRGGIEIPDPPLDVDLQDLTLEAEAFVEGRVTDRQGEPLSGAVAGALPVPPKRLVLLEPSRGGRTGPDGSFRIAGLHRGDRYEIVVELEGYRPAKVSGVQAPTREPLRIVLEEASVLTGRVAGPEGEAVAQAAVQARPAEAPHAGVVASAHTDEEGGFRLFFIEPGTVTLTVAAAGYRSTVLQGIQVPARGEAGPIEVSLDEGSTLTGRVLDDQGKPVPAAQVSTHPTDPLVAGSGSEVVSVDAEGRYRLEGLDLGPHAVSAWVGAGDPRVEVPVEIRPGTQSLDLRFERVARVSGRVTDPAGAPVSGPAVYLWSDAPAAGRILLRAIGGANGTFVFPSVPKGAHRLTVLASGFAVSHHPEPVRVAGRDLEGLELRLLPEAVVAGRILGLTPEELAVANVLAVPFPVPELQRPGPGQMLPGTVDRDGGYRLRHLAPGQWRVMAQLQGSERRVFREVRITTPGEEVDLDLDFGEPEP